MQRPFVRSATRIIYQSYLTRYVWLFGQFPAKHTRRLIPQWGPRTVGKKITRSSTVAEIERESSFQGCYLESVRQEMKILRVWKEARKTNKSQEAMLMVASRMQANVVTVQGPPGAGKTRSLRDMIIALTKVGHKVLF